MATDFAIHGSIFNPFDYYHCRTTVCSGVKVPPITFKDLKADPYFSQLPIVRKNLQGINGWELTARDYSELLRIIEQKGGDTSTLPHLFEGEQYDFGTISNEHDVEENILIPCLQRLGYTSADWVRQLSLKAGRKEKAIPDFVFFPHGEHHHEHAPLVIEAKFDMASMQEYNNAYYQARSYANMLHSSLFAICDKERIVVYQYGDNINNPRYECHWATIFADSTVGARLKQLIGREVIKQD
ncbi:MAG: type I restriction enzyme HsdR N-terminal domain-containing protein [Bacteroidales bacterium]|nr:type I restriction enzyme HsdR N-terminal domain-containing protein [Bacteroidales bacterium]